MASSHFRFVVTTGHAEMFGGSQTANTEWLRQTLQINCFTTFRRLQPACHARHVVRLSFFTSVCLSSVCHFVIEYHRRSLEQWRSEGSQRKVSPFQASLLFLHLSFADTKGTYFASLQMQDKANRPWQTSWSWAATGFWTEERANGSDVRACRLLDGSRSGKPIH